MKVIAHLVFSFGRGGMENVLAKLVNGLDPRQFRHVIVSFSSDVSLRNRLQGDNWRLHVVDERGMAGRIASLLGIMKAEEVDIIHARGWPTMVEAALLGLLLPRVRCVYSFHGRCFNELSGIGWRRKFLQLALGRLFDVVATLTPTMQREIARELGLAERRIKVVPNGIDPKKCTTERSLIREELGIGCGDLVVGTVGRLDPVKDFDTVIRSFEIAAEKCPASWLVIVGEGPEEGRLRGLAARTAVGDRIVFAGFRENVVDLMASFDVYVQASRYEGFSNTLLEAMSSGLTVVCSDAGGNGDIVSHGDNGFLFPVGDEASLARHLVALLGDEQGRKTIGVRNASKTATSYSVERMLGAYEDIYRSLHRQPVST